MGEYSVNHWGSHPDDENDDCFTGWDFDTLDSAEQCFRKDPDSSVMYIELDGPDVNQVRKNPNYRPSRDDDSEWQRERAMQAGMAFGCQGYNEEMGYD